MERKMILFGKKTRYIRGLKNIYKFQVQKCIIKI